MKSLMTIGFIAATVMAADSMTRTKPSSKGLSALRVRVWKALPSTRTITGVRRVR